MHACMHASIHVPLILTPHCRLLDIGCGWGTLVAYAAKNFGCDATGVTLAKNQTQFGTERIAKNGVSIPFALSSQPLTLTNALFLFV